MDLKELVRMSNRYGSDPELVLAGGGNTSVKDGETLYVKCSGTRLGDIGEEGFAALDRGKLSLILKKAYPSGDREREAAALRDLLEARREESRGKRPSVEALLHHLFPQRYVLHVHPAMFNGLTCSRDGRKAAAAVFGDAALWIPLCRPGYVLAKLCMEQMKAFRDRTGREADLVLLENHGVFAAGDSVAQIDRVFGEAAAKIRARLRRAPDCSPAVLPEAAEEARETLAALSAGHAVAVACREAQRFLRDPDAAAPLLKPFTPDHIVYCGAYPLLVREARRLEEAFREREKRDGAAPRVVLIPGVGAFAAGKDRREAQTAALLFEDAVKIAAYSENFGGPKHMTEELIDFIAGWEVESYRKKLDDRRQAT